MRTETLVLIIVLVILVSVLLLYRKPKVVQPPPPPECPTCQCETTPCECETCPELPSCAASGGINDPCSAEFGCAHGLTCDSGFCQFDSCPPPPPCPPHGGIGEACVTNVDCANGLNCVTGTCQYTSCPSCPPSGGGIGDICMTNGDCATGLTCASGFCECSKPSPPTTVTATLTPGNLDVAWSSVAGADYYDVYISDGSEEQFELGVVATGHTFSVLGSGPYLAVVYAVSETCGTSNASSNSANSNIVGPPPVTCTYPIECPSLFCQTGTCASCTGNVDCPPGYICSGGNCVLDTGCGPCAPDEICNPGCVCPQPQVIAVKMINKSPTTGWNEPPGTQPAFEFILDTPGIVGNFEIAWASYGAGCDHTNPTPCQYQSGYRPNFGPMNGQGDNVLAPPISTSCQGPWLWGCPNTCGPGYDLNMLFVVRVQSACSPLSSYTYWHTDGLSTCANGSSQWLIPY